MKEPKYVVTAVNQLTGEREQISRPHSRWKTEELLTRARRDHRRHRTRACYSLHRMERYIEPEGTLPFAPPPPLKSGLPECKDRKSVLAAAPYFSIPAKECKFANGKKRNNQI